MAAAACSQATGQPVKKSGFKPNGAREAGKEFNFGKWFPVHLQPLDAGSQGVG